MDLFRLASGQPPWREPTAARGFLSAVADVAAGGAPPDDGVIEPEATDRTALAAWLVGNELASPAYALARRTDPALAGLLRRDALGGAAATAARLDALTDLDARFAEARIPLVLLKGAAVAGWAYADPSFRTMTDLDLWVRDGDMERAGRVLEQAGYFRGAENRRRPPELERLSGGERVFRKVERPGEVVELHHSAFQGWWTMRAAAPEPEEAWRRAEPADSGRHARRLAAEDAILQIVTHTVVNRFSQSPLRALLDVAVASRRRALEWRTLARRAEAWHLRTASWTVLDAADRLFGVRGGEETLLRLRPSLARRIVLEKLFSAGSRLALVVLSDEARGAFRLVGRTLWPEPWWLVARYGAGATRSRHLRELLRNEAV